MSRAARSDRPLYARNQHLPSEWPLILIDLYTEEGVIGRSYLEPYIARSMHAGGLLANGAPVVLAGDYNVMPIDLDVYAPERWVDDALFRPEVREAFRRLTGQGWTDSLRMLHPNERIYTFWKYFRNAFARDAGLRIDHLLLSPPVAGRLAAAGVDRAARAREHASDHAPAWIEIADTKSGPRRGRRVVASAPSS